MKYFTKDQEIKEKFEFAVSTDENISDATWDYMKWVFG